MAWTYETMGTPIIPNTVMRKKFLDGVHKVYEIQAVEGYVLHDTARDWYETDDPINDQGVLVRGYGRGTSSCGAAYDFTATTIIDGYTAYGSREFFARPESEVPTDQIFGGGGNDHEVM